MVAVVEQIFPSLTWRIRHVTMYPEHPLEFVKLEKDFEGIHFGIYLNHELSGVVSLFTDNSVGQFRKLAILPEAQQNGLGTQLMLYLIDFCKVQKMTMLWCNARVKSKAFYSKLGFKETDQTYTAAGYDFVKMELHLS
ncbi:MAG: GNAT family N-acetyltransferase [Bacteroidia bacterium]